MYTNIVAVALRTVRHNDRSSILTAWSPSLGRLSLVMPAGNGPESRRRRALTMPLCLFECTVDDRGDNELMLAREMKSWGPEGYCPDVSSHPVRATVAMFIAEVLWVVTREGDADPVLWNAIVETVSCVAGSKGAALSNLPTGVLLRLANVLGIEPDFYDYRYGMGFDMIDGVFRTTRPMHDHWVANDDLRVLLTVNAALRDYRHLGLLHLSRNVRTRLMDGILRYFVLHHYPLDRLKSLDVLKAVFSA